MFSDHSCGNPLSFTHFVGVLEIDWGLQSVNDSGTMGRRDEDCHLGTPFLCPWDGAAEYRAARPRWMRNYMDILLGYHRYP